MRPAAYELESASIVSGAPSPNADLHALRLDLLGLGDAHGQHAALEARAHASGSMPSGSVSEREKEPAARSRRYLHRSGPLPDRRYKT